MERLTMADTMFLHQCKNGSVFAVFECNLSLVSAQSHKKRILRFSARMHESLQCSNAIFSWFLRNRVGRFLRFSARMHQSLHSAKAAISR
jgi:hypothetical protein